MFIRSAVCCMSGMAHGSVKNSKTSRPSEMDQKRIFDMYREGPSFEVRHEVSLLPCTTPVSANSSARCGQPQLQWQCEQRGDERQLLVVHTQRFRERMEPQLQFVGSEHEQQQPLQRLMNAARKLGGTAKIVGNKTYVFVPK